MSRTVYVHMVAASMLIGASFAPSFAEDAELAGLLRKLDRVATLYRDEALRFTCNETISLYGRVGPRSKVRRYSYVFVYDEEGRLRDHRLERDAKKGEPQQPVDLKRSGLPAWVLRAYSSILLFEAEEQERYRYEIVGREKALKRPAIRIALEPRPTTEDTSDLWYGTVWIDEDTYQMLRFEGLEGEHHARRVQFEQELAQWKEDGRHGAPPGPVLIQTVTTEFGVQRNGMRFPSRTTIQAHNLGPGDGGTFKVVQVYERYRFYNVRTTEQVRRVVWAED